MTKQRYVERSWHAAMALPALLAAALLLAAHSWGGTARASEVNGGGPPAERLSLEFDKRAASPSVWVGSVNGAIEGDLATILIDADTTDPTWRVEFFWVVTAPDPAYSFVARLAGTLDSDTGAVAMQGFVVDGFMAGAWVEEAGQLYDAERSAFRGTIVVH